MYLFGRDTDEAILDFYGIKVKKAKDQFEKSVKKCSFCGYENSPNAKFCEECNGPLDSLAAEQSDNKVRKQRGHVNELIEFIKRKHPKAIVDFYEEKGKAQELRELRKSEAET